MTTARPEEAQAPEEIAATPLSIRFAGSVRRGLSVSELLMPVPPSVVGVLDEEQIAEHRRLAESYRDLVARVDGLTGALPKIRAEDERATEEAVLAGKPLPKPKLPSREAELEEAERRAAATARLISSSAEGLLRGAAPSVDRADQAAAERWEAATGRAGERLRMALEDLAEAQSASAEEVWLDDWRSGREPQPWRGGPGGGGGHVAGEIRVALAKIEGQLESRRRAGVVVSGEIDPAQGWSEEPDVWSVS